LWLTIGIGIVAAVTSASLQRQPPKLEKAQVVRASIEPQTHHQYTLPLAERDCVLATLRALSEAAVGLTLRVHAPDSERVLRQLELGKAPLEIGFCIDAAGTYTLELRAADSGGDYELTLDAVLPRKSGRADLPKLAAAMSPQLRALAKDPEQLLREATARGTPLLEPDPSTPDTTWVSFVYRGTDKTRSVMVSWSLWAPELEDMRLARLPGTDVFWKSVRMPSGARFSYQLIVDAPKANEELTERAEAAVTQVDPLNKAPMFPALPLDAYTQLSTSQLPAATPERWLEATQSRAHGRLEEQRVTSEQLGHAHALTVYLPPGYDQAQAYPLVIFFDGRSYLHDTPAPQLLDALISERAIVPLVAVFVHNDEPNQRATELPCNPRFAQFVARELLPFVRERYSVSSDTALAGQSFGGLASSFIALTYPELFGKVLSQSGSYWWSFQAGSPEYDGVDRGGWLRRRFAERPAASTQFYMSAGSFEGAREGNGLLEENRLHRDALRALGYAVVYQEFAGGHDHLAWRANLPDGLVALFAP
jgi:enterochelin esterase-like enzyme